MSAVLTNPLKLLTGLFDEKARAHKALNRARERQAAAEREFNQCSSAINAVTIPDPALHRPRLAATKAQLEQWKQEHKTARAELSAATAEVTQAEGMIASLTTDLASKMTLETVKVSYREARGEWETLAKTLAEIQEKRARAMKELADKKTELTHLTARAVASSSEDYRATMAAISRHRDEAATAELLLPALENREQQAVEALAKAKESVGVWERRLWARIAEEQFTPAELAAFGERILTAYAAKVASGENGSLHGYLLNLFAMSKLDKEKIAALRGTVAKEHGIAAH